MTQHFVHAKQFESKNVSLPMSGYNNIILKLSLWCKYLTPAIILFMNSLGCVDFSKGETTSNNPTVYAFVPKLLPVSKLIFKKNDATM